MKQKRHSVDEIIAKLRRADVELGKGKKVPEVCKGIGITEQTYYRWRQKYGSMQPAMAHRLSERLKRSKLHVFDHCGYFSYQDKHQEFGDVVTEWVSDGFSTP